MGIVDALMATYHGWNQCRLFNSAQAGRGLRHGK
jgi:hypothetical protein